jgi:hypothetical protein
MKTFRLIMLAAAVTACREDVTAPGACPDFCPAARLETRDTLLTSAVMDAESYSGYVLANRATTLQVVSDGSSQVSRALVRFRAFSAEVAEGGDLVPVEAVDSFRLQLNVRRRREDRTGYELQIHRMPVTIDSSTSYDDARPYFADSTLLATVLVPDSVEGDTVAAADSILVTLPGEAFPTLEPDSFVTAIGVALRADQEGYVDLAATDQGGRGASITWFVKIDSSGTLVGRQDSRVPSFDGFVVEEWPPGPDDALLVGGIPSARTFLRFDLPHDILNASTIVRATLLMVPAEPLLGAAADTVTLVAFPLLKDFGPKSKPAVLPRDTIVRELEGLPPDTVVREQAVLAVGTADSIVMDITRIIQPWQGDSTVSQSLVLLLSPEGGSIAELRLQSPTGASGRPALRLTYVPFFSYEEPLP